MDANPSRTVIEPGDLKTLFSDRSLAGPVVDRINSLASQIGRPIRIMEVCGTHTVALRRSGIHSLLPKNVILVSGPGCPVCVTPTGYIDNALSLLDRDFIVATFGDMLKVPGSEGFSLSRYMGSGRVRIVYSPAELLSMKNERIVSAIASTARASMYRGKLTARSPVSVVVAAFPPAPPRSPTRWKSTIH